MSADDPYPPLSIINISSSCLFESSTTIFKSCTVRYGHVRLGTVLYGHVRLGTVRYGHVRLGTVWYDFDTVSYGQVRLGTVMYG
jgi:hypothetical protein